MSAFALGHRTNADRKRLTPAPPGLIGKPTSNVCFTNISSKSCRSGSGYGLIVRRRCDHARTSGLTEGRRSRRPSGMTGKSHNTALRFRWHPTRPGRSHQLPQTSAPDRSCRCSAPERRPGAGTARHGRFTKRDHYYARIVRMIFHFSRDVASTSFARQIKRNWRLRDATVHQKRSDRPGQPRAGS